MTDLFSSFDSPAPPKPTSLFERMATAQRQEEPAAPIAEEAEPVQRFVASPPPPREPFKPEDFPGRPVASFFCYCGGVDEVLEPAPETVDCWRCKKPLAMRRYQPRNAPPSGNARQLTDAERSRI